MSVNTHLDSEHVKVRFQNLNAHDILLKKDNRHGTDAFGQIFADMQKPDTKPALAPQDGKRAGDDKLAEKPKTNDKPEFIRAETHVKREEKHDDDTLEDTGEDKITATEDKEPTVKTAEAESKPENPKPEQTNNKPTEIIATETNEAIVVEDKKPKGDGLDSAVVQDVVVEGDADIDPNTDQTKLAQASSADNQAQNAKAAVTQESQTSHHENHKAAAAVQGRADGQTISFRPDVAASDDTAGKHTDTKLTPPKDAAPVLATESAAITKAPEEQIKTQDVKNVVHQAIQKAKTDDSQVGKEVSLSLKDLHAMAQEAGQEKKDIRIDSSKKAEAQIAANPIAADSQNSNTQITHPAAGTRVLPLTGISSPSSNGLPSGGSPLSQAASAVGKVEGGSTLPSSLIALEAGGRGNPADAAAALTKAGRPVLTPTLSPAEQVAVQLNRMAKGGLDRIELKLNPAELGRVDVRLEMNKEGLARVVVTTDNPATHDMMQKDSRSLERALQQAGLQTDNSSMSFNLRNGDTHAQPQGRETYAGFDKNLRDKLPIAANDEIMASTHYNFTVAPGRIDVRV